MPVQLLHEMVITWNGTIRVWDIDKGYSWSLHVAKSTPALTVQQSNNLLRASIISQASYLSKQLAGSAAKPRHMLRKQLDGLLRSAETGLGSSGGLWSQPSSLSFQRWSLEAELLYLSGSGREHESSTQLPPASIQEELELPLNSTVISGIHKEQAGQNMGVSVVATLVFHDWRVLPQKLQSRAQGMYFSSLKSTWLLC